MIFDPSYFDKNHNSHEAYVIIRLCTFAPSLLDHSSCVTNNLLYKYTTKSQPQQQEHSVLRPPPALHSPRRFSNNTQLNINRGLNIINCWSGQHMAAWIYTGVQPVLPSNRDTWTQNEPPQKFLREVNDTFKLHHNDTLFVSYSKIEEFVTNFLPHITSDIVIITTPFHFMYPSLEWTQLKVRAIIEHPSVLAWFTLNKGHGNYSGGYENHPKVHSFPLGLKPKMGKAGYRNPVPSYRKAFLKAYYNTQNKTRLLFLSPIRATNSIRSDMLQNPLYKAEGNNLFEYSIYLREIARSMFILSPDGDHPDCHRHYESIGL